MSPRLHRYLYFGNVAARLDDVASYIPARLTALAIAGGAWSATALRTWRRDGGKHKSPNAGQPESAMAGALRVRLGGENTYAPEHPVKRALRMVVAVSCLAAACALLVQRTHPEHRDGP